MGFDAKKFYGYMDRKYALKEGELALKQKDSELGQQNNEANRQNYLAVQGLANQGSLERTNITAGAGLIKQKMADTTDLAVKNIGVKSAEKIASDKNTTAIDVQGLRNDALMKTTAANNAAELDRTNRSATIQARQAVLEGGIEGKLTTDSVQQGLMWQGQEPDYSALKQVSVPAKPIPNLYKQRDATLDSEGKPIPGELFNTSTGLTKAQEQGLAKQGTYAPADVRLYDDIFSLNEEDQANYLQYIMNTDKKLYDRLKSMYNQETGK